MQLPREHVLKPPARVARILALVFSVIAVGFSIGFGVFLRRLVPIFDPDRPERWMEPAVAMLVFLLFALLFRMAASLAELVWLERTWSNLPEDLRRVGPVDKVSSGLAVVLGFVPGLAWIWKLGLAIAVCDAFEKMRARVPFAAPVPRALGMAAVIVGWVPGLNVYVAPFFWEVFATKMDVAMNQILAERAHQQEQLLRAGLGVPAQLQQSVAAVGLP